MSKQRCNYRQRVIEVTTFALKSDGFTVHFDIENHTAGSHVDVTHFESGQTFTTESEAIETGFELAKKKIDSGQESGSPIEDIQRPY